MLPIRHQPHQLNNSNGLPTTLHLSAEVGSYGLPVLYGELRNSATSTLEVTLQVRNSAGIPIIQARTRVAAGSRELRFDALIPVGIDAYAHKPIAEQHQIAERIWSRRSAGTLHIQLES